MKTTVIDLHNLGEISWKFITSSPTEYSHLSSFIYLKQKPAHLLRLTPKLALCDGKKIDYFCLPSKVSPFSGLGNCWEIRASEPAGKLAASRVTDLLSSALLQLLVISSSVSPVSGHGKSSEIRAWELGTRRQTCSFKSDRLVLQFGTIPAAEQLQDTYFWGEYAADTCPQGAATTMKKHTCITYKEAACTIRALSTS